MKNYLMEHALDVPLPSTILDETERDHSIVQNKKQSHSFVSRRKSNSKSLLSLFETQHNQEPTHQLIYQENTLQSTRYGMTMKSEEMFQPIDLESSLGKIEDDPMHGADDMDCEPCTKTCEQSPFLKESTNIAPYPIAESNDEIRERQRLNESVGKLLPPPTLQSSDGRQLDWVPEDLEPVEDPVDDDEFSLTSAEEESLVEENAEFEEIEDRVSFWDSGVEHPPSEQQLHPSSVSFSSHADESQI